MSKEKPEYIRIRVAKIMYPGRDIDYYGDGNKSYNPDFITKLHEEDAIFREPIITFINDAVGTHTWAIQFAEFIEEKIFDVKIYCADKEAYYQIVDIIRERIKRYEFKYYHSGTLEYYIGSQ